MSTRRYVVYAVAVMLFGCASVPENVGTTASSMSASLEGASCGIPAMLPDIKVGDSWRYNFTNLWTKETVPFTIAVKHVDEERILMLSGKRKYVFTRNLDLISGKATVNDPAYPQFVFPLTVGKRPTQNVTLTNIYNGAVIRYRMQMAVLGCEIINVPAGTFNAIKVRVTGSYTGSNNAGDIWTGNTTDTIWFVPKQKWYAQYEFESVLEGNLFSRWRQQLVSSKLQ